jgi:hypothetical protein
MIAYYTTKVILDIPEYITTSCTSPAGDHLFTVRDALKAKFLPKEQAQAFHHTVAQLLFLCTCTCRDIQTAISFLTTRHQSQLPGRGQLGQTKMCPPIPPRHTPHEAQPIRKQPHYHSLVGRHITRHPQRLPRTYGRHDVSWQRGHYQFFQQTQDCH